MRAAERREDKAAPRHNLGIARIRRQRLSCVTDGALSRGVDVVLPAKVAAELPKNRQHPANLGKVWIARDRLLEEVLCRLVSSLGPSVHSGQGAEIKIVDGEVRSRLAHGAIHFGAPNARLQ